MEGCVYGCEWWMENRRDDHEWRERGWGGWGSCEIHRSWDDPVGPQILRWFCGVHNPEVFKDLQPCTKLGMQNALAHNSGRSAPGWCPFWAFNAHLLPFLALNARTMLVLGVQRQDAPILGVQRQNYALFWRLNARQMLLQGVIFLLLFFIFLQFFQLFLWLHMIMNL